MNCYIEVPFKTGVISVQNNNWSEWTGGGWSSRGVLVRFVYTCRIVDQHCLYFFSHYISYQMSDIHIYIYISYDYNWIDSSAGEVLVPEWIIYQVTRISPRTWFMKYMSFSNLQFYNNKCNYYQIEAHLQRRFCWCFLNGRMNRGKWFYREALIHGYPYWVISSFVRELFLAHVIWF